MTNISEMTDEQLNEALAIDVMGWGLDLIEDEWGVRFYRDNNGKSVMDFRLWQPCVDLNQAVECAEKVWAWKLSVNTSYVPSIIHATVYTQAGDTWFSDGDTPARALCEAVLMAVRGEG